MKLGFSPVTEELSYLRLRRSGWKIGSYTEYDDKSGLFRKKYGLFVSRKGRLYRRDETTCIHDELESFDRAAALEKLAEAIWIRAKKPLAFDAGQLVKDYFYFLLNIK